MITPELARRSQELAAAREPFVTATVVRARHPTSVEAGNVALVLADGTIEGFVGGTCAEQSVKAYSLAALSSGEPVLLRILPDAAEGEIGPEGAEVPGEPGEEGVVTVTNPCLSGGAIEVFLEPAPPAPRVLLVGETPIVAAASRIGPELGLEMVITDGHDPEPAAGDLALVVAAHGRDEPHALRRALGAGVPYVGLVASDTRGAAVIEQLRADGVSEELLERVDVPAGIAIGSHGPGEIAISILAAIVSVRRRAPALGVAAPAPIAAARAAAEPAAGSLAIDPICGMTVAAVESTLSLQSDGETIYFCGEGCRAEFEAREQHASAAR
jgi:xanthine dehydrogenase accessory factor